MSATLDTVVTAETPEGMELRLPHAGYVARACAFLIDASLRLGVLYVVFIVMVTAQIAALGEGKAIIYLLLFVLYWLYPVVFELGAWAATPGKRAMGLQVIMDNGLPITPTASLVRNVLRVVDLLPFAYGFGIVCMLFRTDFKRLGDIAAGTLVVYRARVSAHHELPACMPCAPPIALSAAAQSAIVSFAMRVPTLTAERAAELALLAQPIYAAQPPQIVTSQKLVAIAHWLLGRREVSANADSPAG